jgi:glycine/D-amino acid oxidase-like deaminating enzyme
MPMSLDLRTGKPVWSINKPRIARHKKLMRNIRSDVVVVGGGISGALIAHRLTNLGMRVTIIDSRKIGAGSTAASTAILSYEADVNLGDLIKKIGKRPGVRAYRAGIEAIESIGETIKTLDDPCDFKKRRSLYLASNHRDVKLLEREFKTRQKNKFNVRLLPEQQLATRFSLRAPCAILNEDAAEVNPLKLTLALVRCAQKKGLRVFIHTKVKTYRRQGTESVLTTDDNVQVRARHVVFATGYESQQFLKQKTVRLVSSYAIASKPGMKFPEGYERPVIWETARPYLYVRTTVDSRIVAGGEDVDFVDEGRRDRLLARKTKILERKIRKMFPHISWKLAAAWTGTFAESSDGLPYIGPHKDFPGAQFALGYGGNGITFSAIASLIIPDLISGIKNRDARLFRFDRRSKQTHRQED